MTELLKAAQALIEAKCFITQSEPVSMQYAVMKDEVGTLQDQLDAAVERKKHKEHCEKVIKEFEDAVSKAKQ